MDIAWHDVIGTMGVACVLLSYAGLQTGRMTPHDPAYLWLNIAGSGAILVSLYFDFNLASAIIQCFWIAISLYGLTRRT